MEDHLLSTATPIPSAASITRINPLVVQAVQAFRDMGYCPTPVRITHYNDAAAIPIFYNPRITTTASDGRTQQMWTRDSALGHVADKLYYIAQLYTNFTKQRYHKNPWVPPGRLLTLQEFNDAFIYTLNIRVAIFEMFAPFRVGLEAAKVRLTVGNAMNTTIGWKFNDKEDCK